MSRSTSPEHRTTPALEITASAIASLRDFSASTKESS